MESEDMHYMYRESYPGILIDHMKKGGCFSSFASVAGVSRQCLYNWLKDFPKFQEAKDVGEMHSLYYYEKVGLAGMMGKAKGFNAKIWELNMRNRFKEDFQIVEKFEAKTEGTFEGKVEHSGPGGGPLPLYQIMLPHNGRDPLPPSFVEKPADEEPTGTSQPLPDL